MSITEEAGGRLNAFAKEPRIEVINQKASGSKGSQLFLIAGILLVIGLIAFSVSIS